MNRKLLLLTLLCLLCLPSLPSLAGVRLGNSGIALEWDDSCRLTGVRVGKHTLTPASRQRRILYCPQKPDSTPAIVTDADGTVFPDPKYRYVVASWQQNLTSVSLNKAGQSLYYTPSSVRKNPDGSLSFFYKDENMLVREDWSFDAEYGTDIVVRISLTAGRGGWYSIVSPSLAVWDKEDFEWAAVPGICQGRSFNPDFIRAAGYGQGIPEVPMVFRERTATAPMAYINGSNGVTQAVIAEPGTARHPWLKDCKTHAKWCLGLSLMNREGEFTPTLCHPVLGEDGSYLEQGGSISFSFRYTLVEDGWFSVLKHSAQDIYKLEKGTALKKTRCSLTDRIFRMHDYLVSDKTSRWRSCEYGGMTIAAQDYLGGVYGAQKDAMKNSDYGAMWMLARLSADTLLLHRRLPYALNFRLAQQCLEEGFFKGSSAGQYFLWKSGSFTEEWGPYTEPVATTYYMLMDLGNIMLFEDDREDLKDRLRFAADCLLGWMKPDGSWEVAYDNESGKPLFTDLKDLRPTFYGLLVAWKILGDGKYLDAASKGALWYVRNAVEKGHFIGVCGDTRFSPDFAAVQAVEALLEMYEADGNPYWKEAAIRAARLYTTSIYTYPEPTCELKNVKGRERADWEISQVGLGFEHGGVFGSANHHGPILLASHAGLFVRLAALTSDSYFLQLARAAVKARDAFVDWNTGVASYYWDAMDNGPGAFPHHAWWQIGWIMDYLVAEASCMSDGRIDFPAGFMTPKVGPHRCYGFAPGTINGKKVNLILKKGLVSLSTPEIDYLTAEDSDKLYVILLNTSGAAVQLGVKVEGKAERTVRVKDVKVLEYDK